MHYFSSKGVLLGVPGFLGYFFGVCVFFINNEHLALSSTKGMFSVTLPPNTLIVNFASSNSSSPFEDFNATNCPPFN